MDFWYANYQGKEEILKNGKRTGQYKVLYSNPVNISENLSAARGSLDNELFGIQTDYDRTITSCNRDFDISESSVLWIEKTPEVASDGSTDTPWDYVVVKVARSINSVTVAIRKVSVQ
nr:MAG TPA: hypothetical protein [Caudoviricetes sp.]